MKDTLRAIIMATLAPPKAIKLFLEFEKAPTQIHKLTGAQKMTDKIKVWKCCGCASPVPCIANERLDCGKPGGPDWQPTTDYQITERDSEENPRVCEEIQNITAELKKIRLTPPRKRVKIIWSEVNAENVHIAAILNGRENPIEPDVTRIGRTGFPMVNVSDIPKSWLEDIPAEPVSAEALLDKYLPKERMHGGEPREYNDDDVLCIIGYAEANNELRHQPQQSFDEWWSGDGACFADDIDSKVARMIWGASQINRSHDSGN